jgi:hypothetical protein
MKQVQVQLKLSPTGPYDISGVVFVPHYLIIYLQWYFHLRIEDVRLIPCYSSRAAYIVMEVLEWLKYALMKPLNENGPTQSENICKEYMLTNPISSAWAYYAFDTWKFLTLSENLKKNKENIHIQNPYQQVKLDTSLINF